MSTALAPSISQEKKAQLAQLLAFPALPESEEGGASRLEEVAQQMQISVPELASLLNDPSFLKVVKAITTAQASLAMHSIGIQRLVDIAATGTDREALTAIRTLGQLTGVIKSGPSVEVNLTFNELLKRGRDTSDPLTGILDIKAPREDFIDVEEDD